MKKVYKSKVANWYIWFCAILTVAFFGSIYLCYKSTWILLIDVVLVGIGVLMLYDILLHTDYTIIGQKLYIRCGFLFKMQLPVSDITEITHKSTILSSPALSAKRIGLRYGKKRWIYVSPKDQDGFISDLKSVNPNIEVLGN